MSLDPMQRMALILIATMLVTLFLGAFVVTPKRRRR